jgi:DNA polymerase III sliding clamp (beta) subunit (PCNA family)
VTINLAKTPDTTTTDTTAPAADPNLRTLAEFHVAGPKLDRALRIALTSVSKDDTTPVLTTCALTVTERGNLVVQSTDRYRLVRAVVPTQEDTLREVDALRESPALMPADDVKTFLTWIKSKSGRKSTAGLSLRVVVTDDYGVQRLTAHALDGTSYSLTLFTAGEFPKIEGLLTGWKPATTPAGRVAFNPTYLAEMAKAAGFAAERNTPVEVLWGEGAKPVIFRAGNSDDGLVFDGLLMPVRLPDTTVTGTDLL